MMEKQNRYISFELLFALLLILAFFLPWLDWKFIKVVGWDIPGMQKSITKATNFFKFFSKNKESVYTTYIIYIIPFLSVLSMCLWILLKQKTARFVLMLASVFAFIVSLNLFYKLPKAGSGVYLLCGASITSFVYLLYTYRRNRKLKRLPDTPSDEITEDEI